MVIRVITGVSEENVGSTLMHGVTGGRVIVQKKKVVASGVSAPAAAPTGPRSNFAEFRRQMKLKQKAAAAANNDGDDVTGVVTGSPRRVSSRSPSVTSPARRSTGSGLL